MQNPVITLPSPPAGDCRVFSKRIMGFVVTSSAQEQRDRLARVSEALQSSVTVPTDTFITDDIPLLLTKLSRIPAQPNDKRGNGAD